MQEVFQVFLAAGAALAMSFVLFGVIPSIFLFKKFAKR